MAAAIHTAGLTKHYPGPHGGSVEALADLSVDVEAGEVFGFLGPNGAGKTTLSRTLLDEIRATAGTATILGMDTHRESVSIRRRLGYRGLDWGHAALLAGVFVALVAAATVAFGRRDLRQTG